MLKNLKEEMLKYIDDVENIVSNKEELLELHKRTGVLYDAVFKEVEKIIDYKSERLEKVEKKQEEAEKMLEEMNQKFKQLYEDIYDEYEETEIVCPYCNNVFYAVIDDTNSEIECPECNNIIELDWGGNPDGDVIDDENSGGCLGNCSDCNGCSNND